MRVSGTASFSFGIVISPSCLGITMSSSTTAGRVLRAISTARMPSSASPTTSMSGW